MGQKTNENQASNRNEEKETTAHVRREYKIKDKWDKRQIILSPLGGLITGLAIAIVGVLGSNVLQQNREMKCT